MSKTYKRVKLECEIDCSDRPICPSESLQEAMQKFAKSVARLQREGWGYCMMSWEATEPGEESPELEKGVLSLEK